MKDNRQDGFTAIELIVAIIILLGLAALVVWQKQDIDAATRDSARKTSINAIHYSLEDVYYPANGNTYPETLSSDTVKAIDPELLKDPAGNQIGNPASSLRYEPQGCAAGKCKGYILRAELEKEADFIKKSRRN